MNVFSLVCAAWLLGVACCGLATHRFRGIPMPPSGILILFAAAGFILFIGAL